MKAVLESLQSFLGLSSEDRKPSNRQSPYAVSDASYGGYGFPLLIRRSKPKKSNQEEKQLPRCCSGQRRSFSRRRVHSVSKSEPNLSPPPCKFSVNSHKSAERNESLRICDQSMGLTDCLVNMYSRRIPSRKHADAPFDKCTSEYYSCAKKELQNQRIACKFLHKTGNAGCALDDADVVACTHSSLNSDVSVSSCAEGDVCAQGAQQNAHCGGILSKQGCVEDVVHCKMSGLSIVLAEKRIPSDDHNMVGEVQKTGASSENLHNNGEHPYDAGFCTQRGYRSEERSSGECSMSFSPARGVSMHRRKMFPPPLTTLAMQSYSDKWGQSPEALIAAGYCLRSFRRDGRFVLQEVRAPMPKYFRVLREDGRLKLELLNALGDSSQEEYDAASAADHVCVGVKVPIVVTEVRYASNAHVEADACKETLKAGCMQQALSDELRSRGGGQSNAYSGCASTCLIRVSTPVKYGKAAGVAMPSERVGSAPLEAEVIAASILSNEVGELRGPAHDVDQRMQVRDGTSMSAVIEDMVNPLTIESSSSTRCPEMRARYDKPSTSCIQRSWVHPISAF